jgi:hypothetical protein
MTEVIGYLIIIAVLCLPAITLVVLSIVQWCKAKPLFDQIGTYQNATWANLAANGAYQEVVAAVHRGASKKETDALQAKAEELHEWARGVNAEAYRKYPHPKP